MIDPGQFREYIVRPTLEAMDMGGKAPHEDLDLD